MELPTILALMAIALAIFTIGLQYIPREVLSRVLFGKQEDITVMGTFLGMMGLIGFFGFLALFGYLVAYLTSSIATNVALLWDWHVGIHWGHVIWQVIFGLMGAGLVYGFFVWIYKKSVSIAKERRIAQSKKEKTTFMGTHKTATGDVGVSIIVDLAKMNDKQLKAFNAYVNYLEKRQEGERSNDMPKSQPQPPLTKNRFMRILKKVAQPISEWQRTPKVTGTSESRRSDDYSETRKSQDKTEDKKD